MTNDHVATIQWRHCSVKCIMWGLWQNMTIMISCTGSCRLGQNSDIKIFSLCISECYLTTAQFLWIPRFWYSFSLNPLTLNPSTLNPLYFESPYLEYPDFESPYLEYPDFESPLPWIHKIEYSRMTHFSHKEQILKPQE